MNNQLNTLVTEEVVKQYDENGFVVLRNVFTIDEMNKLKEYYNEVWFEMIKKGEIKQDNDRPVESLYPEIHEISRKNENIFKFMINDRVFDILKDILKEEALIVGNTFFVKPPSAPPLVLHQDNYDVGAYPDTSTAFWISIDSSSPENGALHFVPRSHQYDFLHIDVPLSEICSHLNKQVKDKFGIDANFEIVDVTTEPGDVIILNGNVVHGSYHNSTSGKYRRAFALQCARSSSEKVFMYNNQLIARNGKIEHRKLNKAHIKKRDSVYK